MLRSAHVDLDILIVPCGITGLMHALVNLVWERKKSVPASSKLTCIYCTFNLCVSVCDLRRVRSARKEVSSALPW